MTPLVWFRVDLRLHDHPALARALSVGQKKCRAVFIKTPESWKEHGDAPNKIKFILEHVMLLKKQLHASGVILEILECPHFRDVPQLLKKFVQHHKITDLYFNEQYEINEQKRDAAVVAALTEVQIHRFHEQTLIAPGMILTAVGLPFKVFTPFKKRWLAFFQHHVHLEEAKVQLTIKEENPAFAILEKFLQEHLARYHLERDFPALHGTSQLSPYLAQGIISIRRIFNKLQKCPASLGKTSWINELIWREFYKHILALFPDVARNHSFAPQYGHRQWRNDPQLFAAWQNGQTGFPLIDAAMRQLKETGWMHNRLRMNVAMFLVKLCDIDWRWGERYFMEHLLDGDLAANNGGWQWAAGTGCDAAPYFRVFNPTLQSEKFDPHGIFIRHYCPELKNFDDHALHAPHERNPLLAVQVGYPPPILDYKKARKHAIAKRF
jgi:deoxyribodipyrimidine photo-lyase